MIPTTIFARFIAVTGIVTLLLGGFVSALRHEEIYLICAIAWCMLAAHSIQWLGLASWGLGVLLVGLSLAISALGLVGTFIASATIIVEPISRIHLRMGALAYGIMALLLWCPLYFIFTDSSWGALFRNASGPPLSHWYAMLPVLCGVFGIVLWLNSLFVDDER